MGESGSNHNFISALRTLDALTSVGAQIEGRRLDVIRDLSAHDDWRRDGHPSLARWLAAHEGISTWKAARVINAAHALPFLPLIDQAFRAGAVGLDKVVELCRFATPETEERLLKWAQRVTPASVRRKADVENRQEMADTTEATRARWVDYWWFDEGRRLRLEGEFPADQGVVIAKAVDRMANRLPDVIDDQHPEGPEVPREDTLAERRADALYGMASAGIANDQDPDRATVVVHVPFTALRSDVDTGGAEVEDGPALHIETARRLSCDGIIECVLHNDLGDVVGIGRKERKVPRWMVRQLKRRDCGCSFPGCPSRWFLQAHHIHHWSCGGATDLHNLVLVCHFHHKLLHEGGWKLRFGLSGITHWYRPNGTEYVPNRAPPQLALTG